MSTKNVLNEKLNIDLTDKEISLIKAGLEYFILIDSYGYAVWGQQTEAYGTNDYEYLNLVSDLYKKLEDKSRLQSDFGYWVKLDVIKKLLKEDIEKLKNEIRKC